MLKKEKERVERKCVDLILKRFIGGKNMSKKYI